MELSGNLLLKLRISLDLTQSEMATRIGATTQAYYRWERGKARPQAYYRRKIREAFQKELVASGIESPLAQEENASELEPDQETTIPPDQKPSQDTEESSPIPITPNRPVLPPAPDIPEDATMMPSAENVETATPVALWTPAVQSTIRLFMKELDAMNPTKNDQISRRGLIETLARLPMLSLGLSVPGKIVPSARYGDAIASCATALEGCWELYRSSDANDILLAFQCVSKYLPILKTIANDSAGYRRETLDLATQYTLLKALLGWNCTEMTEATVFAKDAVALSKATGDISLQLSAYRTLARRYFDDRKYVLAQVTIQEGEGTLKEYQKISNMPPVPSNIAGWFYSTYALVQTKNGESPDYALGVAIDSETDSPSNALKVFTPSTQAREAALICYSNGDQAQAMKWIAKRIDPETLVPRIPQTEWGRVETINVLVRSLIRSKERDMEKVVHHWTAGSEGARALKHEQAFSQAVANFEALEDAFPGEKRIQELRPLTVHW